MPPAVCFDLISNVDFLPTKRKRTKTKFFKMKQLDEDSKLKKQLWSFQIQINFADLAFLAWAFLKSPSEMSTDALQISDI